MSKTLSNILTIFKIARILAKIVFICCIIASVCCLLALPMLSMVEAIVSDDLFDEVGVDISTVVYVGLIVGIVSCVGEAIFAFLAEKYFKNVLDAGTPFAFDRAKECFRLGITSLIISVAVSIISGIASVVALFLANTDAMEFDFNVSISISTGLFFLFLSMLFKYGAELKKEYAEKAEQAEQVLKEEQVLNEEQASQTEIQ